MKKLNGFGIGLLISLFLISSVYATSKVALIVKDTNSLSQKHEEKVHQILTEIGFEVVLIDKDSTDVNYSDYAFIVIAGRPADVFSYEHLDDFVADIPVNDYPTIAIDSTYPDDWGWIRPGGMSTVSSTNVQRIVIVNGDHPITEGRSSGEVIEVHTVLGETILDIVKDQTVLTPIVNLVGIENPVIAVAEHNTTLYNDEVLNTRIVFFGVTNSIYWTSDVEDLFRKCVDWLLEDGDEDGISDALDNCPSIPNPDQLDTDGDDIGNACDDDDDNDSISDISDFCPLENSIGYDNYFGQGTSNSERDGCIDDVDSDFIKDNVDNCVGIYNPSQSDADLDGLGDPCDTCPYDSDNDVDNDGICGDEDNCPLKYNPSQSDDDGDGIGDVCEILPYQVLLDVDDDEVNETAINENNITDDGFEVYDDSNRNTRVRAIDGDFDGMTDWLIDINPYGTYDRYWDPDDGILTNVSRTDNDYYIDVDDDDESDVTYNSKYDAFITRLDTDSDSNLEIALDTDFDGSYDDYRDPDWSSRLLDIEDGDEDGKNDFIIGVYPDFKPAKYWDPDDGILTNILETDVDNDEDVEYALDTNGDGEFDKVYNENMLYESSDLIVNDVSINPSSPVPGDDVYVTVTVRNVGGYDASDFIVELRADGTLGNKTISLGSGDSITLTFSWDDVSEGSYTIRIIADSTGIITESNEDNNEKSIPLSVSPPVTTGSGGGGGGVTTFMPRGTAGFTEFPEKLEVDLGDIVSVSGKFENNLNYDLNDVEFSIQANGFNPDWYVITPSGYDRIEENDSKGVLLEFGIPENAEIYTYSVTIKASADSRLGNKTFSKTFSLLLKERIEIPETTTTIPETTTTIPEEVSPLTGFYLFVESNRIPIAVIIILIMILIVWKLLNIKTGSTKDKKIYIYGKGWIGLTSTFKFFSIKSIKDLLTKW